MFNSPHAPLSKILGSIILLALPLAFALGLSSCKAREDLQPEKDPEPLTAAQSDQFNAIIDGLGRPEQIVRIMKSMDPTWGTTDTTTNNIISVLNTKGCNVLFSKDPDAQSAFKRNLQVTGSACPLQLHYELKQGKANQAYTFLASFLFTDEALAQANKVRGGTINWDGRITSTSNSTEASYRWTISGNGTLTLTEGNKEVKFLAVVRMLETVGSSGARQSGYYRFDLSGLDVPMSFLGEIYITPSLDASKYRINGTTISKTAFEGYLAKLGFLSGADSFNEGH